jgi:predicted dehydrogenase
MNTVRWGILGAGRIAHAFVRDFPLLQNAELIAVASGDEERAKNFALKNGIPVTMNHEAMYQAAGIDAVYIATTHNFHYEHALQCLMNGKAVLCEKPITVNDRQFRHLARVAAEKKVFLMEAMWTCFLPAIQKAKEWVDDQRAGKLTLMQCDFGFAMNPDPTGRMYNPMLAGGALLDLGVYPVAMAGYFTGQAPHKILASGTFTNTGVDETLAIILQYQEITASLCTSLCAQLSNAIRIYGDKGFIEIPTFWKASTASLYDKDGGMQETFEDGRNSHGFIYEMQHANDLILAGELQSPLMTHERSNQTQETLMEIRKQVGLHYPFE